MKAQELPSILYQAKIRLSSHEKRNAPLAKYKPLERTHSKKASSVKKYHQYKKHIISKNRIKNLIFVLYHTK